MLRRENITGDETEKSIGVSEEEGKVMDKEQSTGRERDIRKTPAAEQARSAEKAGTAGKELSAKKEAAAGKAQAAEKEEAEGKVRPGEKEGAAGKAQARREEQELRDGAAKEQEPEGKKERGREKREGLRRKKRTAEPELAAEGNADGGALEAVSKRPRKKIRKRFIVAAVIVVLIAVNVISRLMKPEELPVMSGTYAQKGDVEQTLDTSGYVSSEVTQTIFSPVTAYISESNVEEGQLVSAGDNLITFDTETLEKAAQQAKLTKDSSAYGYQDTLTKANKNDQDLANANTSIGILEQQIEDEKSHIANIQEDIRNKQAEAQKQVADQAAPIEARNIEIGNRITQVESEISSLRSAITAASETSGEEQNASAAENADVASMRVKLVFLENELNGLYQEKTQNDQKLSALAASAGVDTSSQESALADAQEQLAEYQSDLAKYEGQKSSAEAGQLSGSARAQIATNQKLDSLTASTASETLEKARAGIQADMNGVVTDIQIVDGAPVSEGGALFKISSMDDVKVDISVTKYNLENIAVGQKADITVAGKDYEGTVTKINRIATKNDSGTPVVGAQLHIDNPDENLFLGVEARVSVHMAKSENVVLVPVEAVNNGTDGSFCWIVNSEGMVEKRPVTTGVSSTEYTEITSGIEEGEFVISNSAAETMEGMKVTPMDSSAQ